MVKNDPAWLEAAGWKCFDGRCRKLSAVAAVAAHMPDSIQCLLLEGDRLCRVHKLVRDEMWEEMNCLANFGSAFWKLLVSYTDFPFAIHIRNVVKFMEYLGRNGVHKNFGVEVGLFEDVFDKAVAGSWAELRKQGLSEGVFVDRLKNAFKVLSLDDDFVLLCK
eukprot:2140698-Amphidinium_carterae.2